LATVLKNDTGMEQKIQKTKRQLQLYQKFQNKEKIIYISIDIFITLISAIVFFAILPVLFFIGLALGYCVSRYAINKKQIIDWINSKARDRYFYLEYLTNKQKGEESIGNELHKKTNKDFYLINGAVFEDYDSVIIRIPHVMLCPDGTIVCIESHNLEGKFSASAGGNKWRRKILTDDGNYISENNFTDMRNKSYESAKKLHSMFGKKLRNHKIVSLVVMANNKSGWVDKQESFCPIVKLKQLPSFLHHYYGQKKITKEENEYSAKLLWTQTIGVAN